MSDAKWNKEAWEFSQNPTESPFSFSEALKLLRNGHRLARSEWNGKGIFIELQVPDKYSKMTSPYIFITGLQTDNPDAPRSRVPWQPSQTDLLASDWLVNE